MSRVTPSTRSSLITGTAGAQSTTVSIPAPATFALIAFCYWDAVNTSPPTSVTLDSQSATLIDSAQNAASNRVAIYKVSGFSTGASKTLAYTNPAGGISELNAAIEYRTGIPTYGAHGSAFNGSTPGTSTTAALANTAGDEIISAFIGATATISAFGSGQTALDQTSDGVGSDYGFTTEIGSGTSDAQSITGNFTGIASTVVANGGAIIEYYLRLISRRRFIPNG